jgi:DNA repair exonuclease SbcCD ATPase subunit
VTDQTQQKQIEDSDLDLIDPALEDAGKTEQELWNELEAVEKAAKGSPDELAAADAAAGSQEESTAAADSKDLENDQGKKGAEASPEDRTDAAAGKPAASDVWANATPEQLAARDALVAERQRLEQADRSNRGRVSALQRQIDGLRRPAAEGGGEPAKPKALQSEKGKKLREEYPEIAEPVAEEIETLRGEVADLKDRARKDAIAEQTEQLEEQHKDWQAVAASDDFGKWVASQPEYVREAVMRNADEIVNAVEAGDVISRFKSSRSAQRSDTPPAPNGQQAGGKTTGSLSDRRRRQLESSSTARSRGPGVAQGIPEDGDEEALWKAWDEHDRRRSAG